MNALQDRLEWRREGYWPQKECYILGVYCNGVRQCTMRGYLRHAERRFRVYPLKLDWGTSFPKAAYVNEEEVRRA